MEIYLNLNNKTHKLSLFDDEELTLTKKWDEQQVLQEYGSFSSTFNVPIDSNNSEIFGYYNEIGSIFSEYIIDPNYYISSKIIVDSYEFLGNVQLMGFTEKYGKPYSFQIRFYGDEQSLIKKMGGKTLNDVIILKNFVYNYENVVDSWTTGNIIGEWNSNDIFIPLMANSRPLVLNTSTPSENNIYPILDVDNNRITKSGITMTDLYASYSFKYILNKIFYNFDIIHNPSTETTKFLEELFIMSTSSSEKYGGDILSILGKYDLNSNYTDSNGNYYTILNKNIYLDNNIDTTSFYGSPNGYHITNKNEYKISLAYECNSLYPGRLQDLNIPPDASFIFDGVIFAIRNGQGDILAKNESKNRNDTIDIQLVLEPSDNIVYFTVQQRFKFYDPHKKKSFFIITDFSYVYSVDIINFGFKITVTPTSTNIYNNIKEIQKWPNITCVDFFLNFCKSFNIFFIYDSINNTVNTYFKDEIPRNIFDLTSSMLQNNDTLYNNKILYKKTNFKFKEAKDINNIKYFKDNKVQFGNNLGIYNYDIGEKELIYESQFTVFPQTNLIGDDYIDTNIMLHSELNESGSPITSDFLLFYRNKMSNYSVIYNLQNGYDSYKIMHIAPKYGPYSQQYINTKGFEGYSLDYNNTLLNIYDNITKRYEVTLSFLLDLDIVENLKVYDLIIVNNIYYEIKKIDTNIKNGYTTLKLVTTSISTSNISTEPPVIVTTTTTTAAPCNPLTITCTPTYFDHGVYSAITFINLVSLVPSNTPPLTGVSHMYIRNLNISYPAALKYNGSDVYENQKILFNNTLDDLQYSLIYYTNQNNNNTYTDSFDIYFVMDCGAFTNIATKEIIVNAAVMPTTTTTTTLPVNTHPPVTLGYGSDPALTLDEENQVLSLDLSGYLTGTTIDKFIDLTDTFNTWPSNHGQMLKVGDNAVEYSTKIGSDATGPWIYVTESHEVTSDNRDVDEMGDWQDYGQIGWTYYRGTFTHVTGNTNLLYSPTLHLKYSEDNYDQTHYLLYVVKESLDPINIYLNGALIRVIDGEDGSYNCPFTVPSDGDYVISFEVSSTDAVTIFAPHIDYYYYTDVYTYTGGLRIVDNTYTSQLNYPNHAGNIGDVCVMDDDGLTMTFKSGIDANLITREQLSGLTGGQLLKYYPSTNTFLEVPDNSYKWNKAILKDSFSGLTSGFMYQDSYDNYRIIDISGFTGDYLSKDDFGDGLMKISGDTTSTIPDNSDHWNTLDTLGQKKFWQGTAAEYAAIGTKDANTIYFINVE